MPGPIAGYVQTFADDFTGASLDPDDWQTYWGVPGGTPGGCWDPSHDVVGGGELDLETYADPGAIAADAPYLDVGGCPAGGVEDDLVSGGLKLVGLSQTYGIYEVRMRADDAQGVGVVALLWPTANSWPPEIDFAEDDGADPRSSVQASLHVGPDDAQYTHQLPVDASQWHTYGVIWSPGELQYTIDGTVWATTSGPEVPDVPMQLVIQSGAADCGGWEVCPDQATARSLTNVDIDWVVAYAPTSDGGGSSSNVTDPATSSESAEGVSSPTPTTTPPSSPGGAPAGDAVAPAPTGEAPSAPVQETAEAATPSRTKKRPKTAPKAKAKPKLEPKRAPKSRAKAKVKTAVKAKADHARDAGLGAER